MHHIRIFVLGVFVVLMLGCTEHTLSHHEEIDQAVERLELKVEAANVTVEVSDGLTGSVDIDIRYWGDTPNYVISNDGGTLTVAEKCPYNCEGEITVRVPAGAAANIDVASGNADIRGIEGNLEATLASGNLTLSELSGRLDLQASSGNISGRVQSVVCYADADSGNIDLQFDNTPTTIDTRASSGNISLEVPTGPYNISTHVDSGTTRLENVGTDPSSPNEISAVANSGNIRISGI